MHQIQVNVISECNTTQFFFIQFFFYWICVCILGLGGHQLLSHGSCAMNSASTLSNGLKTAPSEQNPPTSQQHQRSESPEPRNV